MFGKSILVSPVMDSGVSEWKVYLPENQAGWYDWWTGEKTDGGQYVAAKVDIETIPVYIKGGSIVPTGPDRQHVTDNADSPVTVNIYPGADATFTLYEDEGDNYNYENGSYSTIRFVWNDADRTLTIEGRQGSFDGMVTERTFIANLLGTEQTVAYDGSPVTVKF